MVPRAASHATPAWLPIHLSLPISSPVAGAGGVGGEGGADGTRDQLGYPCLLVLQWKLGEQPAFLPKRWAGLTRLCPGH